MKRGVISTSALIFSMGLTIAAPYNSYSNFSPSGGLASITDPETLAYAAMFVILFSMVYFALSKFFKNPTGETNKGIAGTISLGIAALMMVWSERAGFNPADVFSGIGIYGFGAGGFSGLASSILPLVALVLFGIMIWRFGFGASIMVIGAFMILTTFTSLIVSKGSVLVLGLILLIGGFFMRNAGARAVAGGVARRKPMWAMAGIGIALVVVVVTFGVWWLIVLGLLIALIGFAGKK